MKKYLIDLIFETLLLIGIIYHHQIDTLPMASAIPLKIILSLILIYTLRRVFSNVMNLRFLYVSIIITGTFLFVVKNADVVSSAGTQIELCWQGYYRLKWVLVFLAFVAKNFTKEEKYKNIDVLLMGATKYLKIPMRFE